MDWLLFRDSELDTRDSALSSILANLETSRGMGFHRFHRPCSLKKNKNPYISTLQEKFKLNAVYSLS